MTPASTSLIVRCFNEEAHIGRLLSGLTHQTQPPNQIIVVDSGSTDATLEIASRYAGEIHSIRPEDFSFGRSLNIGCRAAQNEILVFASAHVYPVFDTWLSELTRPFHDPAVALVYGRQEGDAATKYSERRVMERWFPAESNLRQDHAFCNNANAAVRRSVWSELPYDEELTGLEDVDWARRARDRGHVIAYVATAPVYHAHDETMSQIVNRYRREAMAHRRIYRDHRMGPLEALRLAAANVASDYVHAARDRVLLGNVAAIPAFRAAQFWGTYRGFNQRGDASPALRRHFYYPHGWGRLGSTPHPTDATRIDYQKAHPSDADAKTD